MIRDRRAAIYAVRTHSRDRLAQDLMACAKRAYQSGCRVVALSQDIEDEETLKVRGPKLRNLVDRLWAGEFDVIIAKPASGGMLMIEGVPEDGATGGVLG